MPVKLRSIALVLLMVLLPGAALESQVKYLRGFRLGSSQGSSPHIPSNGISHMAVHDSTIWLGTSKGVAKSSDGTRSWDNFQGVAAFHYNGIYSLAVLGDTVWAAMGYDTQLDQSSVQTGGGYAYTTDRGATWDSARQTMDSRGDSILSYGVNDSLWVLPVVVPQQNVTFGISLRPGVVWIASWASGLRRSTDRGHSWQRTLLPTDNMNTLSPSDTLYTYLPADTARRVKIFPRLDPRNNNNFLAFSVLAVDDDTIWCGTAGGVNKSTDKGKSWVKFSHQNQASPILGNWVIAIAEQRLPGVNRIWTTNWKANDPDEQYGVSYTENGGVSWKNILHGIKAYDFAFRDSIAYIASDSGVYRTADGGLSFIKVSNITYPAHGEVILTPEADCVDHLGDTILVGTPDGFATTVDDSSHQFGSSWKILRTALPGSYAYPNPFSPSLDVAVRIHYNSGSAGGSMRTVGIEIFDFGMNRVRTLISGAARAPGRDFDETWDGRTDDGRLAANGVYFYRVRIDNDAPFFGKILLIQ